MSSLPTRNCVRLSLTQVRSERAQFRSQPAHVRLASVGVATLLLLATLGLSGCGTPGAPQPPSLKLPGRIEDLSAVRAGSTVTLRWTMPRKTTDHLAIKGSIVVAICRRDGPAGEIPAREKATPAPSSKAGAKASSQADCQKVGETNLQPGASAEYHDLLPASLQSGEPRLETYSVELLSPKGRSAGPSNEVSILAGAAPEEVTGLAAEPRPDGIALQWTGSQHTAVRLHRQLLTVPEKKKAADQGPMSAAPELVFQDLFVDPPATDKASGALDTTARAGQTYTYTAQRVLQVKVGDKVYELAGPIGQPVKIDFADVFPPAVPAGLVAVYSGEEPGNAQPAGQSAQPAAIDLSWQPNREPDLAGYIVYRAEPGLGFARISPSQPVTAPAWRDTSIAPGRTYRYAVSAIDLSGHESMRSQEAQESTPSR
jgi:hypothetical protein